MQLLRKGLSYYPTIKIFEKRLLQRKYPKKLIGKVTARVKFSDRHSHLRKTTVNNRQVLPSPILKCLPPPRFDHLKKVILQEYPSIQQWVPKPRFVTLAHPTLRKILIRANTRPTTVQLFDILLQLENSPKNAGHKTAGVLPIIGSQTPRIRKCNNPRCKTCTYLNCKPCFTSTVTRVRYPIRYSATCSTSNIVYLITCTRCRKQYVGITTKSLRTRINQHRSNILQDNTMFFCIHFNSDHSINNISVQIIDKSNTLQELRKQEAFWIRTLQTLSPRGLNSSPGVML